MNKGWGKPFMLLGFRWLLGGILVVAGAIKLLDMRTFIDIVQAYQILPQSLIIPFSFAVPWVEVVCGGCLLVGFWTRSCACLSLVLLLVFAMGLSMNIERGFDMSCGCFGPYSSDTSLWRALIRDLALAGVAGLLFSVRDVPLSLDRIIAGIHKVK